MNDKIKKPAARPGRAKQVGQTPTSSRVAASARTAATAVEPAEPPPQPTLASRPRRQPSEVELTVAKHQKVLADALTKAQAINYEQPKIMKPEAIKSAKTAKAIKEKHPKARKPKLIRDSFAMPETEYARIDELKQRLAALGKPAKKSEVLRGGISALTALNDSELKAVMERVERIKTGRPHK